MRFTINLKGATGQVIQVGPDRVHRGSGDIGYDELLLTITELTGCTKEQAEHSLLPRWAMAGATEEVNGREFNLSMSHITFLIQRVA